MRNLLYKMFSCVSVFLGSGTTVLNIHHPDGSYVSFSLRRLDKFDFLITRGMEDRESLLIDRAAVREYGSHDDFILTENERRAILRLIGYYDPHFKNL